MQTAVQPAAIGARCPPMRIDDYGPVDGSVNGLSPAAKAGCLDLAREPLSLSGWQERRGVTGDSSNSGASNTIPLISTIQRPKRPYLREILDTAMSVLLA